MNWHIWHTWETVEQRRAVMKQTAVVGTGGTIESHVVVELQRCAKCGAERGYINTLDGEHRRVHPDLVRMGLA